MVIWTKSNGISLTGLCCVLCLFFVSVTSGTLFTIYEEGESIDMTYCSFYSRTKIQELTGLPESTNIQDEQAVLQGDAIIILEQLLKANKLVPLTQIQSLFEKLPSPEPYTLLDFYLYTQSKQKEINRFDYQMQGHRAVLLFLHDAWRIYDPVKIKFPYRQSFDTYREQNITSDMYAYVRTISYSVAEEVRLDVDALFVVPDIYEGVSRVKKAFSQDLFVTTYDDDGIPQSYRAEKDLYIEGNDAITIFVGSGTEIVADDGSPFSIDLLVFDEQGGLILPGKTLLFSKPILFLDATQEAYDVSLFAQYTCTDPGVVIVPHTGTVSLGVCRSGLFGR